MHTTHIYSRGKVVEKEKVANRHSFHVRGI